MEERRGKPLPQFVVDQIRKLRREGLSIRAIQQISGVAKYTVEHYTKGIAVPGCPKCKLLHAEEEDCKPPKSSPPPRPEELFDRFRTIW